jgi:hypothetical protein
VAGAVAYGIAGRSAADPRQRARVAATSWGLIVWWVLTVAAGLPQSIDLGWLQALNRVVGLAVALAILLAYDPPSWWAARRTEKDTRAEAR